MILMRSEINEYDAVQKAAEKFVESVRDGNSAPARELFTSDAVIFGFLDGKLEHGSIEQFYHNVDTIGGGDSFKARTDVLLLLKMDGQWRCVAKAYNQNSDTVRRG